MALLCCLFLVSCVNTQRISTGGEVHITSFGAVGDGQTNSTEAFQRAAAYLKQYGGTLIIDSGTYIVGKQILSGNYWAGASWTSEPILNFVNARKPIIIKGKHATLKAADRLRYGSFNPVTGKIDTLRKIGNRSDYFASAYIFINAENCISIKVAGLTLDGNASRLIISRAFGDLGNQLPGIGIRLYNNKAAIIEDCYIHDCVLDGIIIAWRGLTPDAPVYPHIIKNVVCSLNGRQGLSWVGGNYLKVVNSEFTSTGKGRNNGKPVIGKPTAGIDIEIEESIIRNGYFENCLIYDNAGYGLSTIGHPTENINFKNCTFIGTTNDAAFPKSEGLRFEGCTFIGRVVGVHGNPDSSKANYFKDCLFTMDTTLSPNGKVYGQNSAFFDAENIVFDHCTFNAGHGRLPVFNQKEIEFVDCSFIQHSSAIFRAIATFKGTTRFIIKNSGKIDAANATFEGPVFFNGIKADSKIELNRLQYQ